MKKWILIIAATLLVGLVVFVYVSFNGNIISKMIAKNTVSNYLEDKYEEAEFEYVLKDGGYNFKMGTYYFPYVLSGEQQSWEYSIEVGPSLIPTNVRYEELDYKSIDETLSSRFNVAGGKYIKDELLNDVVPVSVLDYYVDVPKNLFPADQEWTKTLETPLMPRISLDVVDENQTKEQFLAQAKKVQEALNKDKVTYESVRISLTREFDNTNNEKPGYAPIYYEGIYWIEFNPKDQLVIEKVIE